MISVFGSKVGSEEMQEIEESFSRQWLGSGGKVQAFEEEVKERLELDNFLFVDSGSNALYMAVHLLDLPPGSEILVPSFTWVACAQAVLLAGHKPVFCDVDLDTQNVTAETLRPRMTPRTGAVMVVHYAGKPVDMDPIKGLGLPIIEDAAHAIDSRYKGKACGNIGDIGIYSFDAVKNVTTGTGGGITTKSREVFERAKRLRYCGIGKSGYQVSLDEQKRGRWWECDISDVFIRMLPTDIAAGIGLAQLRKLGDHQVLRRNIWKRYGEAFKEETRIKTPADPEAFENHSYFTYFIRVPCRDALARFLLEKGIYTTLRFHPLHLNPIYASDSILPSCEELAETGLNIPLHPGLSLPDVEYVIDQILEFIGASG
jgi:aminotransferase